MTAQSAAYETYRVLVTGSRDWSRRDLVRGSLDSIGFEVGFDRLTVVHGACPTGADALADEWAQQHADLGVRVERVPARWDLHGKAAGPLRNAEMVARGADLCLAFPQGLSRGTRNCMAEAKKAGIDVWNLGKPPAAKGEEEPPPCRYCGTGYSTCVDRDPCCKACLHADGHTPQKAD